MINLKDKLIKTKLKTLKSNIDKHYTYLIKKHPIVKIISTNIEDIFAKDFEDEYIRAWWSGVSSFILDIEKEIAILESEDVDVYKRLSSLKESIDKYSYELKSKDKEFYERVYSYIELVLENKYEGVSSWYRGIEPALEIIEEKIDRIENQTI